MGEFSTHCLKKKQEERMRPVADSLEPDVRTLDFIRRFARAYHAEPKMKADLSGFVLN